MTEVNKVIDTPNYVELKKKRRKRRRRIQLGIFLTIVMLTTLILLYMFTDISYVNKVTVNETNINQSDEILKKADIKKTDRLYSIEPGKIEDRLSYMDGVKSADVRRIFPNKVHIDVLEYEVIGVIPDGSKFRLV